MSGTVDLGIEGLSPAVHLGAGGSANVFAARVLETGEQVAVKLLRASADSDKERVRFQRERETIDLLSSHDGIVHVIDAGVTDRHEPYFLMPLMEGSLQDRIDNNGALDWETAVQLVAEVADTVGFAHSQKILHRDLKPGNILLDDDGVPRVADFGIAKLVDSSVSKSSKALGTPSFMPPERFRAVEATEATDVYGLGATLVALLTGNAPFVTGANDTDAAVMMRVMSEEPPALEDHGVPDTIAGLVTSSMAKDPDDRPASAAEFAHLLRTASLDSGAVPSEGPVTVAIPRRDIEIPALITVVPEEESDEERRPLWMAFAAAAMFIAILGVGSLVALNLRDSSGADLADGGLDANAVIAGEQVDVDANTDDGSGAADGGSGGDEGGGDGAGGDGASGENAALGTEDIDGEIVTEVAGDGESEPQIAGPSTTDSGAAESNETTGQTESTAGPVATQPKTATTQVTPTTQPTATTKATQTTRPTATTGRTGTTQPTPTTQPSVTTAPVIPAPVASFTASAYTVEEGDSITFTSTSTGQITSTAWRFGDGGTASGSPAWHTFSHDGSYTVVLTVTGPGGSHTASRTITVNDPPTVTPVFTKVIEMGDFGDDFVRFRFTTNVTTGYTARIRTGSTVVKTQSGTAQAYSQVSVNMGGLTAGTDYTLQVTLNGPPSVASSWVGFRTSGGVVTPTVTPVTLNNLRSSDIRSDRFQVNYESNICANGSFVIREQGGAVVGSNAGQSNGCTTTHLGIPGFWTSKLKANTTYVITLTVEADGQGKGNGNTATKSITVTTSS